MTFNVRVISPDKIVLDIDAEELILPTSTGQLGILTDHAPLLTALDIGVMRVKTETGWNSIVLLEGFAEVEANKVTVLCNGAEEASSINLKTAQDALEKIILLVEEATTKKEKIDRFWSSNSCCPMQHEIDLCSRTAWAVESHGSWRHCWCDHGSRCIR